MDRLDIFILAIYMITTAYILQQSIGVLEGQQTEKYTRVWLNKDELAKELEKRKLKDRVDVNLKFSDRYDLSDKPDQNKQPRDLSLSIKNKSDETIYVDWDRSSLTDLGGRSRRVIRLVPYQEFALSVPQVFSVIGPGQTLQEKVTAEDLLGKKDDGSLEIKKPLIDIQGLQKSNRDLYSSFMAEKTALPFYLCLVLQMPDPENPGRGDRLYTIRCEILTQKLPRKAVLPWKK